MTKNVVILDQNTTVAKANQLMMETSFKSFPVVSNGDNVVGIVTLSDLWRVPNDQAESTTIRKVMTQNVISIAPDDSLYEALRKMTTNGIGRLPVLDRSSGKLIGIITRTDLFRSYEKSVDERLS